MKDVSAAKIRTNSALKRLPPVPAGFYRVEPGDTLFRIAFEKGLDYPSLAEWNNLVDPDHIQVGTRLRLSAPAKRAGAASVASSIAATPTTATKPTFDPNISDAPPARWVWPVNGTLIGRFGENQSKGIDIAGHAKQPVLAAAGGQVAYVGSGLRGYGKLIIIRHGKTLLSAYAHNERILVNEGQQVAIGQIIGEMGKSDADRVKLHFEIRELGKPVDPMAYLPNGGLIEGTNTVQLQRLTIASD